jgi:hypothetical protein
MTLVRTALIVLAAFAGGAVTAAVFVSRPIPAPADTQQAQAPAPAPAAPEPAQQPSPVQQSAQRPEPRIVRIDRPPGQEPQTTGAAASAPAPSPAEAPNAERALSATNSCNQAACSRAYRSFDNSTCTYQPTHGGPRRHCEK